MNVGILGGTFNPPHLAHLVAAEAARDQFDLSRVLWVPSREPPHKGQQSLVAPEHRLAMARLATQERSSFVVSEIEMRRTGPSYTVDTIQQLQDEQPDTNFSLILGGDSLRALHTWHAPDEIARRITLVAYERAHDQEASRSDSRFVQQAQFVEAPRIDLSSTDIRQRCREGRSIRYLVPAAVRSYIRQHGLYEVVDNAAVSNAQT